MRIFFTITLLGLIGCGGDDGSGPSQADVTGTWSGSVSNMNGGGISCSSTQPTEFTLNQSGTTFSGTYSGGTLFCTSTAGSGSAPVGAGSVINGSVNGSSVSFDLDTPDSHFTGSVSGNSMSGTAQLPVEFGPPVGVVTLSGNWSATQQ